MEWKQPEGIRRHWVLEELDEELMFLPTPVGAAQGRIGDDLYNLREQGILRKRRTLAKGETVVAQMEASAAGGNAILHSGGQEYRWRQANLLGNRWLLEDAQRRLVFGLAAKPGLGKFARIEMGNTTVDRVEQLLLLCWYVTVL